jgi:hypothetical protein
MWLFGVWVGLQDLPRTFPRHAWLSSPDGQAALRSVLTAYAGHNSDVGYCQVQPTVLKSHSANRPCIS